MTRMPFAHLVPPLTDGVVRLRAHRDDDVARIVEQCIDPDSIRWTTVPHPYAAEQAGQFLDQIAGAWQEPEGHRWWALSDADDPAGAFLGTIDLRPLGAGLAEVGFGLHPAGRGRGLMARALRLACAWWFAQGGERVHWRANRGNFGSWRVAWACGFAFDGVVPGLLAHRGEAVDGWTASAGRADELTRPAAPWRVPVVLAGGGVRLRAWRPEDVEAVELDDTPEHFEPPGARQTPDTFAQWLLRREERMMTGASTWWCIADAATDRALGLVTLIEDGQEPGCAELGYALFPSARGRGAATIGSRLALDHGFAPVADGGLGLRKVVALTVGDNQASAAVLERLGFAPWGREPAFCERADGTFDDARHWALLPS